MGGRIPCNSIAAIFLACLVALCPLPVRVGAMGSPRTGEILEAVPCLSDSSQTYSLYLPTSYSPNRASPALLVFDPRGRSVLAAERFRRAAESFGWILLSADGTRSDGPWEPNRLALEALWPEVHGRRYNVDPQRVYAAGFSGGALVAWYLAQFGTPTVAGVIACGGRTAAEIPLDVIRFAHFGAAGTADFNFIEMQDLDRTVALRDAPHQFRTFPGRHQWMPPELAYESVEWMEILAMQRHLRPIDVDLVARAYGKSLATAESLQVANQKLEAVDRYRTIAATWHGLRDVSDVRRRLQSLQEDPETRDQERITLEAERFERDHILRSSEILGDDRSWGASTEESLRRELRLPALQELARDPSPQGLAARRVLEWIFTRASFYLARERLEQARPAEARLLLHIALDIHPEAGGIWYELARAEAQGGARTAALHALAKAVDLGFADLPRLLEDPSFDSLRSLALYDSIVFRLRRSQESPEPTGH